MIISNTDQTDGRMACGIGGPMVKKQSHSFDVLGRLYADGLTGRVPAGTRFTRGTAYRLCRRRSGSGDLGQHLFCQTRELGFLVGDGPDVYALAACGRVTFSRTSVHLDFWSELPSYVRLY